MTGADPVARYWSALEADLARFYGYGPKDIAGMSWRHLSCCINALWGFEGSLWADFQRRDENSAGWAPEPNLAGNTPRPVDVVRRAFADARKVKA